MVDFLKPSELAPAPAVFDDDAIMVDNAGLVQRATPVQVVNAGNPVATEAEALAGVDNSARMTPLRVKQVLDNTSGGAVALARAWAESATPPDITDPTSKSSKTWAGEAAVSAEALGAPSIQSIAGLTPDADRFPYYTGASTAALAILTPFARTLLDDTSQAAMRTTLGLVPTTSDTDTTAGRLLQTAAGAVQAFRRGNILGTVSLSGGVPTGALIESNSNVNGTYERYASGLMLCWIDTVVTDQAIDAVYGSLFTGIRPWTFPSEFISAPVILPGYFRWGTNASWGGLGGTSVSGTTGSLRGYDTQTRAAGTNVRISALAIGKWG